LVAVQGKLKYGRTSEIGFGRIDYVKYAEAFGAPISRAPNSGAKLDWEVE
jgi:thiamine pyrophosphate-dependent acetolactate synthase large subunit-like protein